VQSDDLKDNYNRKLDEIIEFFKIEKETTTFYFYIGKEDSKFSFNVILSVIVILLAVSTTLSNIDTENKKITLIIIVFSLIFLGLYMIFDLRSSNKRNNNIIHETIKFNFIISFIQSLKILPYEVDLSKLINKLKNRYHIKPNLYPFEKYIEEIWFDEIVNCFDEINKEILEKEKISSVPK